MNYIKRFLRLANSLCRMSLHAGPFSLRAVLIVSFVLPWEALVNAPRIARATEPCPGADAPYGENVGPPLCPTDGLSASAADSIATHYTRNPVFTKRGSVVEEVTDLSVSGPAFGWSHKRSYDSHIKSGETEDPNNPSGVRWHSGAVGAYLYKMENGDIRLKTGSARYRLFTKSGGTWAAPKDFRATLTTMTVTTYENGRVYLGPSGDTDLYVLENEETGVIHIFSDFDGSEAKLYEKRTRSYPLDQYGVRYLTYGADGVEQILTADPQSYVIDYDYTSQRLTSIVVSKIEGETLVPLEKVEYTYFGSGHHADVGSSGDLVQVKVLRRASDMSSDMSSWIARYTQYRYFRSTSSNGKAHQIKAVFEAAAVQRVLEDGITDQGDAGTEVTPDDILWLSDSATTTGSHAVDAFASRSFTYYTNNAVDVDSAPTPWNGGAAENLTAYGGTDTDEYDTTTLSGLVKTETVDGACGSCGSNSGVKRTYHYLDHTTTSTDLSAVKRIIVEDNEDADGAEVYRRVWGLDSNGAAVREALIDDPTQTTFKAWCRSKIINNTNEWVDFETVPSAHAGLVNNTETLNKFLDPLGGSSSWKNDSDTYHETGAVYYQHGYNSSTRRREWTKVVFDDSGSPVYYFLKAATWGDGTTHPEYLKTKVSYTDSNLK